MQYTADGSEIFAGMAVTVNDGRMATVATMGGESAVWNDLIPIVGLDGTRDLVDAHALVVR